MRMLVTSMAVLLALAFGLVERASAGPALLFDAQSGAVLYAEDVDQAWHPASLTKLMTAYLTFKALKEGKLTLDQELTCDESAASMAPSKLGLKVGQKITVDLALKALVVKSANDMAVLLSEAIGGSEQGFAEMMNAEALRLGMKQTHYVNASGLPQDQQVTSARDLATLTQAIIRDYPDQAYLFSLASVRIGKNDVGTHNTLLKTYDGADGMKTGFICDSGYNIVASATRDGHRLVAVVLGESSSASRNVRATAMLDFGFQNYFWKTLFSNTTVQTVEGAQTDTATPVSLRDSVTSCVMKPAKRIKRKGARTAKPAPAAAPSTDEDPGTTASVGDTTAGTDATAGTTTSTTATTSNPTSASPTKKVVIKKKPKPTATTDATAGTTDSAPAPATSTP